MHNISTVASVLEQDSVFNLAGTLPSGHVVLVWVLENLVTENDTFLLVRELNIGELPSRSLQGFLIDHFILFHAIGHFVNVRGIAYVLHFLFLHLLLALELSLPLLLVNVLLLISLHLNKLLFAQFLGVLFLQKVEHSLALW